MVKDPPQGLVRDLGNKRVVLFAGAGLSRAARLPTWQDLLKSMVDELAAEEGSPTEELDFLIQGGKLLEVADYCKEILRDRLYNEFLRQQLRGDDVDIPRPHEIICHLPFRAIITTNYDKLLEQAYSHVRRSLATVLTHKQSIDVSARLFDEEFFILKAHGDIDDQESLILTVRDYQNAIHSNAAFNEALSTILLTNTILFIGYSLSDPDFRLLLDRQLVTFKGNIPPRYALMSGIGKIEQEVLRRTAGIRVIPYDDHEEDVPQFLDNLYKRIVVTKIPR
jgi:hypothetical protein